MELGRKKGSVKIVFLDPVKSRRRRLLVAALVLVCLLGLGYSLLGARREGVVSVILPSTAALSGPSTGSHEGSSGRDANEMAHTSPGAAPQAACDDLRVLVDRSHTLPPDYAPRDLVSLLAYDVPTLGGREMLLRRDAAKHLRGLESDAEKDGEELVVASAFRSYPGQQASYSRLKSIYGSRADALSATPGHSQHQLGTAVDFTNAAVSYQVRRSFAGTSAAGWLTDHATKYGFVLAYPRGGDGTGYEFEPWHYRYVGVHNAGRLEQSGLTLQKFLVRERVLPDC